MNNASRLKSSIPLSIPGLTLEEEIGRGAYSLIYRARKGQDLLAVKVMREELMVSSENILRFRREAGILARIAHPALVKTHEVGNIGDRPYLVMELVQGETLGSRLSQRLLSEEEILHLAETLAQALAEVHRHGLVHRDVKPENILISQDSAIKLIDFGLATRAVSGDEESAAREVAGTFLYSAPEQNGMLKRPVDGRSDFYALGAVLYQCATGKPPFSSNDVGTLIQMHATQLPQDPCQANPYLSKALGQTILKLLAKDPDDRYQSGAGLIADVRRIAELNAMIEAESSISLGLYDDTFARSSYEVPLVGREKEFQEIHSSLKKARQKNGSVILIDGEPGCGKSRLLKELLIEAKKQNALIFSAKCSEGDPMPFAPLKEVMDQYLRHVQKESASERTRLEKSILEAMGEYAPLFKRFSPLLGKMLTDVPESAQGATDQDHFYDAWVHFLVHVGQAQGITLLCIDDIQWLDAGSRQVLKRLSEYLPTSPLLVAATGRSDPASREKLDQFAHEMEGFISARVSLAALAEKAVQGLIASLLGNQEAEAAFVQQIYTRSNGSPFAVGEYVRAALDGGMLKPYWGKWLIDSAGLKSLELPSDVIQLVVLRANGLSAASKEILSVAALLGSHFDLRLLPRILAISQRDVNQAITEATGARLIELTDGGGYAFLHDRVQEAFLTGLTPERKMEFHQKIAEAIDQEARDGSEDLSAIYSLAKHYALGWAERNAKRVYETNLEAGIRATQNYAVEEAYSFLQTAYRYFSKAGLSHDARLEEALGDVCIRTGRLEQAIEHLKSALALNKLPLRRAQIRARMVQVYVANFRKKEAWEELEATFRELDYAYPKTAFTQILITLWEWSLSVILRRLGIGYRSTSAEAREKYKIIALLCERAGYMAFIEGKMVMLLQMVLRPLYAASRLGPSPEMVLAYTNYSALLALFKQKKAYESCIGQAEAISETTGDRQLVARAKLYRGLSIEFLGLTQEAQRLTCGALQSYQHWYDADILVEATMALSWNFLIRGKCREGIHWIEKTVARVKALQSGDVESQGQILAVCYNQLALYKLIAQSPVDAQAYFELAKKNFEKTPHDVFNQCTYLSSLLLALLEQDDLGNRFEEILEKHRSFKMHPALMPLHLRQVYVAEGYARLAQYLKEQDSSIKAKRLAQLRSCLKDLWWASNVPNMSCHRLTLEAACLALSDQREKHEKALSLLDQAESIACATENQWALYEIARNRARIHLKRGLIPLAARDAQFSADLATQNGWRNRARAIHTEFQSMELSRGSTASTSRTVSRSTLSETATHTNSIKLKRHLDALLQINLASSKVFDPVHLARIALDEIVRILGAERAFLFLCEQENDEPKFAAGRDALGQDLTESKTYSSTVVVRVIDSKKPIVVSGTNEGEILATESAVAHDLRSIMAAPILLGERLMGLVYLDNRLAKGLFGEEDVEILMAISNHIGIAIESAKAAKSEIEKKALEKDLVLTAAVQSLLLPKQDELELGSLKVVTAYQPASRCGGDWWWAESASGGKLTLLIGDVTGHGPASAMVTAAVVTYYRTLSKQGNHTLSQICLKLNELLMDLCQGEYLMTLSALELDSKTGQVKWLRAGAPHLLRMRPGEKVEPLLCKGSGLLGLVETSPHEHEFYLEDGEKLMVFTDGMVDLPEDEHGRKFNLKDLCELFDGTRKLGLADTKRFLLAKHETLRLGLPQNDDVTLALIGFERKRE